MLAWHFVAASKRLKDGQLLERRLYRLEGKPILCRQGFHASIRPLDALRYAPGPIVCRVRLGGTIVSGTDKIVSTEREVLAFADASTILHTFACDVAEEACRIAHVTNKQTLHAIATKRAWLVGKATKQELDAAQSAAWSAARSAARSAENAARSAAKEQQNRQLEAALLDLLRPRLEGEAV